MTITEPLRREYDAFRTLRQRLEAEGNFLPQETLFEVSAAVDHLMRADQSANPEEQYDQARQHFARGAKDLYLSLLMGRLDRLRDLPTYLRPDELPRFRQEYQRIKESVQRVRSETEGPQSAEALLANLTELDRFLESFTRIDPDLLMKQRRRKERVRSVLLFLLSALLGAVVSAVIGLLMK